MRFRVITVFVVLASVLLVLVPLFTLALFDPPFHVDTNSSVLKEISSPWLHELLFVSLKISIQVVILTVVTGIPIGLHFAVRPSVWSLLGILHILPLALSPYILGLGFASMTGRTGILAGLAGRKVGILASSLLYGEVGVVLVLSLSLLPIVTLLFTLFTRKIDTGLVEAALMARRPSAALGRVVLPLALPGIGFAALIVFVMSFSEVALPGLLGVKVYATSVFTRMADLSFEPQVAVARSIPPLSIAIIISGLLYTIDVRGRSSTGLKARLPVCLLSGALGKTVTGIVMTVIVVSTIPLFTLIFTAFKGTGGGFSAMASGLCALGNSLGYALKADFFMLAIALPAAWLWSRRPRVGGTATLPLLLGFLTPSAILGVGLIVLWNRPSTQFVYLSSAIVVLGLVAKYCFLCVRAVKLGFDRAKESSIEAARLGEPSPLVRFWKITLIGNMDAVFGGLAVGFLACFRDLDTVVLNYPPGGESLMVHVMTIEANAPPGKTAALAVLQLVATILIGLTIIAVIRGREK